MKASTTDRGGLPQAARITTMRYPILLALLSATVPAWGRASDEPAAAIRRYYAALEAGDRHSAMAQCDVARTSQGDCVRLAEVLAGSIRLNVRVGKPRDAEGAAGSIYVGVPVDIRVTWRDGQTSHFNGLHTMRRINVSSDELSVSDRWRTFAARLRRVL